MHTRFLTVLTVSAFILTLLFAVAAGAQDESTDAPGSAVLGGGGGIQVQEAQQQQVQNSLTSSQQGLIFAEGQQADGVQTAATGSGALRGTEVETRSTDNDRQIEVIRVPFPNDCRMTKNKVSFVLQDEEGTQADFIEGNNVKVVRDGDVLKLTSNDPDPPGADDPDIRPLNERGGDRQLDTGGLTVATSTGIECDGNDNNGGGDGNGGGGGGGSDDLDCADFSSQSAAQDELEEDRDDPNNLDADNDGQACEDFNYGVGAAQTGGTTTGDTTTADTTTGDTTTAAADAVTAGDGSGAANREGSFRCESFLHVVRDENGALRRQYNGDELVVQRFEQCLEADVLANTIPNRLLPDTGGPSLPVGGGVLLLVVGTALALRMIRR